MVILQSEMSMRLMLRQWRQTRVLHPTTNSPNSPTIGATQVDIKYINLSAYPQVWGDLVLTNPQK